MQEKGLVIKIRVTYNGELLEFSTEASKGQPRSY